MELIIEPSGSEIGLLLPDATGALPHALAQINVTRRLFDGETRLYVSTASRPLYQEFYHFLESLADAVQLDGKQPLHALHQEFDAWRQLLQPARRLTEDAEVGLFGELWLLNALLERHGPRSLDSWTGPLGEPHDFRFGGRDFEVKTTRRPKRIHTISTITQLLAVPGKPLFLLSIQVQPAGDGGQTLVESITAVRQRLAKDAARLNAFSLTLERTFGYTDADAPLYDARYELRSLPHLVAVDADCPAITPAALAMGLGPAMLARVEDVRYAINVEGLGVERGSAAFEALLPIG